MSDTALGAAGSPQGAAGTSPRRSRLRMPLVFKLEVALIGLVVLVLVTNGAVNFWLNYNEATRAILKVQQEKAASAAEKVGAFVASLEGQIGWTTRAEWRRMSLDQQRYDFIRLLRQAPAVTEVAYLDQAGREQLRISRLEPDRVGSGKDLAGEPMFKGALADKVWYGPVYFRRGSEPYMTLAIAHAGRDPGVTVAEVNLKLVWDVISAIRVGENGFAFVTTPSGKLIAHPDLSLVLRDTDLSGSPQVARALARMKAAREQGGQGRETSEVSEDVEGERVLTAYAPIDKLRWLVFVQSPTTEAMAPVYSALMQSVLLLVIGLLLAIVCGTMLARRLTVPIRRLQEGADRLGSGDLSGRIVIRTGDEIETLADRFNQMAARIQESYETLEAKVEERTHELSESLDNLRAAQDRLIQSEKLASLGQLTAGIAHEIKNPLNFVNNFSTLSVELLDELEEALAGVELEPKLHDEVTELAEMLRGNLRKVAQHGARADSIVRNMLLHSREGSGEHRPTEVNGLVEEALNLAYHGARAEKQGFNMTLERSLDPAAGSADLYPQEITRVLLNLISNGFYAAIKRQAEAGPGFAPTLGVATRDLGDRVEIRVRDNGTGISEEVRDRMFNPFFTTKPAGEGTGLGLSLSHDIVVKQHGGTIEVRSAPGEGTEFTVILPRAMAGEQ